MIRRRAYGKPAPVDPSYLRAAHARSVLVALAGPVANARAGGRSRASRSAVGGSARSRSLRVLVAFVFTNVCPASSSTCCRSRGSTAPASWRCCCRRRRARCTATPTSTCRCSSWSCCSSSHARARVRHDDHGRDLRRCDRSQLSGRSQPADGPARCPPRYPARGHGPRYHPRASTSPSRPRRSPPRVARPHRLPPDRAAPRRPLGGQHREHARRCRTSRLRVLLLHRRLAHAHHPLRPDRRAARRSSRSSCSTGSPPASTRNARRSTASPTCPRSPRWRCCSG